MEELHQSTFPDFVIACAGLGSRMQEVNSDLHKALLPLRGKPILEHIVSSVPREHRLVFLLGHQSKQIRDFVELVFPDRLKIFVSVPDFASEMSGTGVSLLAAESELSQSFWYTPCDGIFSDSLTLVASNEFADSVYVGAPLDSVIDPSNYCLFRTDSNKILDVIDKPKNFSSLDHSDMAVFTGLMFIKNKDLFFSEIIHGGHLNFTESILKGSTVEVISYWRDLGHPSEYKREVQKNEVFDFSKPNEVTYQIDHRILKWWSDDSIPLKKAEKPKVLPDFFPLNIETKGQFLIYEKVPGSTLYPKLSTQIFENLLEWLENGFWLSQNIDLSDDLTSFYIDKSRKRIDLISNLLPYSLDHVYINNEGLRVEPRVLLEEFPWTEIVSNPIPTIIHGDLQFDNIILKTGGGFSLIDWRPEFGKNLVFGDKYYDLAKLYGGMLIDYSQIKKNQMEFNLSDGTYSYSVNSCQNFREISSILEHYIHERSYSWRKVRLITALIYLNMCPLHERPFADILFFKAFELLGEYFG